MVVNVFFRAYTSLRLFEKVPLPENGGAFFYLRLSQFLQLFTCINVILFMSIWLLLS